MGTRSPSTSTCLCSAVTYRETSTAGSGERDTRTSFVDLAKHMVDLTNYHYTVGFNDKGEGTVDALFRACR